MKKGAINHLDLLLNCEKRKDNFNFGGCSLDDELEITSAKNIAKINKNNGTKSIKSNSITNLKLKN